MAIFESLQRQIQLPPCYMVKRIDAFSPGGQFGKTNPAAACMPALPLPEKNNTIDYNDNPG